MQEKKQFSPIVVSIYFFETKDILTFSNGVDVGIWGFDENEAFQDGND